MRPRQVSAFYSDSAVPLERFKFHRISSHEHDSTWLEQIFKLRYEVYCLERQFLDAHVYPEALEMDAFDHASTHFAGFTQEDDLVATVRLVKPPASQGFPFQHTCGLFDGVQLPPAEQSSEISRLIVRKSFRQNRAGSASASSSAAPAAGASDPRSPELLLGMYRAMYRHSRATGVRYWYAAMERSLACLLRRAGFAFTPIGPTTDYYGPVTPFLVDLDELNRTLERQNPLLWAWFNQPEASVARVVQRSPSASGLRPLIHAAAGSSGAHWRQ
ncbi:MAG: PEP-CTERM/exosortase system-associated acyltransferase [Pseudomonadota bacterium]